MDDSFRRILSPHEPGFFLACYLERCHFHIARNDRSFYAEILQTSDIDRLLQNEQLPAAFINVVRRGKKIPISGWSRMTRSARGQCRLAIPEKVLDFYSDGATLILNRADHSIPSLNLLCRRLAQESGFQIHANIYLTPPGSAGFRRHADQHEVFVLQIAGSKTWSIEPRGSRADLVIREGDLLYLPRGLAHSAQSQTDDSIHVTIGLTPAYECDLLGEIAAIAREGPDLKSPMPPLFADEGLKREFASSFSRKLTGFIKEISVSSVADRRMEALVASQTRGWPDRLSDLRRLQRMTIQARVQRRAGILATIKKDGRFLSVCFADKRVLVPAFLEDAVSLITSGREFEISQLDGFVTDAGRIKLAAEFIKGGFLEIVDL